jgi:hypothetical protein
MSVNAFLLMGGVMRGEFKRCGGKFDRIMIKKVNKNIKNSTMDKLRDYCYFKYFLGKVNSIFNIGQRSLF